MKIIGNLPFAIKHWKGVDKMILSNIFVGTRLTNNVDELFEL